LKRKEFFSPLLGMGQNPAHPGISPAPPPFIFLCTA
jgi:hypothetical protein